jgi:hypothetical protein
MRAKAQDLTWQAIVAYLQRKNIGCARSGNFRHELKRWQSAAIDFRPIILIRALRCGRSRAFARIRIEGMQQ